MLTFCLLHPWMVFSIGLVLAESIGRIGWRIIVKTQSKPDTVTTYYGNPCFFESAKLGSSAGMDGDLWWDGKWLFKKKDGVWNPVINREPHA